jgi:hypothetical protein
VFTARYAMSPYIKQIRFVFKGLVTSGFLQPLGVENVETVCSFKQEKRTLLAFVIQNSKYENCQNSDIENMEMIPYEFNHIKTVSVLSYIDFKFSYFLSTVSCCIPHLSFCAHSLTCLRRSKPYGIYKFRVILMDLLPSRRHATTSFSKTL